MSDNTFQRRKEMERRLLAGDRLKTPELMLEFEVSRNAIRRDLEILGEELPLVALQGRGGGYFLLPGPGKYQNSLSKKQLECLKDIKENCSKEYAEIILSIIHEFGPYER